MNDSQLHPSRREVIGAAAGAMLASAAPALAELAGGKEPITIVVIGTGARGSDLIRALTTIDNVRIVALADDYPPHLNKAAALVRGAVKTFADYRKMIEVAKPQAAVIAVPLALHYPIASDVLAAGGDVFLEKTMCYSIDDARKLADQVTRSKQVFQIGLQRRANAIYDQALAMVQAGHIGQISAIKSQWHRNDSWRRPMPLLKSDPQYASLDRRLNWRLYRDSSRGLLAELGSHQMDVANVLLGRPPARVFATGGIDYWRDGREVADNVFCIFEYDMPPAANGGADAKPYTVRVTYSAICNNALEGASEMVMGNKGTLYLTSDKGLLYREQVPEQIQWAAPSTLPNAAAAEQNAAVITAGKTLKMSNDPFAHRGKPIEIDNEGGDDTRAELVSFLDHVRRRDPKTICDARAGLIDAATVLSAHEALMTGKTVEFPKDI